MSDRNSPPLQPAASNTRRRSSIADLFRPSANTSSSPTGTSAYPGPITTAAAQAQRRRLSLTTIGLSGSPTQTSPFSTMRSRGESVSSATSASVDESPFEEGDAPAASTSNPTTPFARRLSFGARALRDVRAGGSSTGGVGAGGGGNGNGNGNGRASTRKVSSPPTSTGRGEGFNFAESLRTRAERSSISGAAGMAGPPSPMHQRARSVAVMEPPVKEVPKATRPDAFQERILKGDFYMD